MARLQTRQGIPRVRAEKREARGSGCARPPLPNHAATPKNNATRMRRAGNASVFNRQKEMAEIYMLTRLLLDARRNSDFLHWPIGNGVVRGTGNQQNCMGNRSDDSVGDNVGLRRNLAAVIDATCGRYVPLRAGCTDEIVEWRHRAVLIDEGAAAIEEKVGVRHSDDLTFIVNVGGFAHRVAGQSAKILRAASLGPQKGQKLKLQLSVDHVVRAVVKPHDYAVVVDGRWRIPSVAAEIAEVDWHGVLPQDRVNGAVCADGEVTGAGNADNLAEIIDGGRGSIWVAGVRRELPDVPAARKIAVPDNRFELQELSSGVVAGGIVNFVFGPADNLAKVVVTCTDGVVAAEARQLGHFAVLPSKRDTGIAAEEAKDGTGKRFVQRIMLAIFGDARNQPEIIFYWPSDVAAGPAESAKWNLQAAHPKRGKLRSVGLGRESGDPADIVDGISRAGRASERAQINQAVMSWPWRALCSEANRKCQSGKQG